MSWKSASRWILGGALCVLLTATPLFLHPAFRPLAQLDLADGRILRVEGLTYGTNHSMGSRSVVVDRFGPWLPAIVRDGLTPKRPRSHFSMDEPALVVWVDAVDIRTGKQVDCQGIRVELVDKNGDVFAETTSSWFGGANFWRVGHVFQTYSRTESELMFRVTPWKAERSVSAKIFNPHVTQRATWVGNPLPQQRHSGDLDIILSKLIVRTNGSPEQYWESRFRYWEPQFELKQAGGETLGWGLPEWTAEDSRGNHGRYLGLHEPVLRFAVSVYPNATSPAVPVLTRAPSVSVMGLQSNVCWNLKSATAGEAASFELIGLFRAGTHVFSDGVYYTNPPVKMGPVIGGAPSGWVGQSARVTPLKLLEWDGHYTGSPVVYLRAKDLDSNCRWGVRLRDERDRLWAATAEPQGARKGIRPFLVELPPDVQTVAVEVVMLKPVQVAFDVDTKSQPQP